MLKLKHQLLLSPLVKVHHIRDLQLIPLVSIAHSPIHPPPILVLHT